MSDARAGWGPVRDEVLACFAGAAGFRTGHDRAVSEQQVAPLVPDDFDGPET